MKTFKFNIPLYDVDVLIVQIESPEDKEEIKKICEEKNIDFTEEFEDAILRGAVNGGDTYRDLNNRNIVMFLYPFDDVKKRQNILCHEKRHIEDRVLSYFGVDDIESAALLAGFLGEKLFEFENIE